MQIVKDVFQLSGYDYGTVTSIYALKGKDSIALVEGGAHDDLEVAKATMNYWGLARLPISHVFMTHSHADHIENGPIFREMGAKIVAVGADADAIELADDRVIDYGPFYRSKPSPCPVDIRAADGDIIRAAGFDLEVLHFPGHTAGSHFLRLVAEGRTILFTGDIERAYFRDDFRSARLAWSGGSDYDRKAFLESLRRISNLKADVLLPSHGQKTMREGWKILKGLYLRALIDWRQPAIVDEFRAD